MQSCSLTSDIWTSLAHDGYINLNIHFIDKNFNKHTYLLDVSAFKGKHSHDMQTLQLAIIAIASSKNFDLIFAQRKHVQLFDTHLVSMMSHMNNTILLQLFKKKLWTNICR